MNLRPLIIDDNIKNEIKRIKDNAKWNPTSEETLKAIVEEEKLTGIKKPSPVFDDKNFSLIIPYGYNVVYTHEMQPGNIEFRHLSVSVNEKEKYPNKIAVIQIMKEFGFINNIKNCPVWLEKFGDSTIDAVNIIEPVDGDWEGVQRKQKEMKI